MNILLTLLLAAFTLLTISLQKTYAAVPVRELKRRARAGDQLAVGLYRAVGYGYSLKAVLWFLIGLASSIFFVVVARMWSPAIAVMLCLFVIWFGFLWMPTTTVTAFGNKLATLAAPLFSRFLGYAYPLIDRIIVALRRRWPVQVHTGLYEREDLVDLLQRQAAQPDNRIAQAELDIAAHALNFGQVNVRDIAIPARVVKSVDAQASVGPVLMSELHKSGHSRFPVYDSNKSNIVGTLFLRDLTDGKHGGAVSKYMRANDVAYLHADQPLTEALSAMLRTHRQLMIVVNDFEEYVGIVTLEDVLERIIGRPIVDEFDHYDDMRAVAAKMAAEDHKRHVDHASAELPEKDTVVVE